MGKNWTMENLAEHDKRTGQNNLAKVWGNTPQCFKSAAKGERTMPKQNKYRNKKCVVDGIEFASIKEGKRYGQLKLMQLAGEIMDLKLQVSFPLSCDTLIVNTHSVKLPYKLIKEYIADFVYTSLKTGANDIPEPYDYVVEDAKGVRTKEYKLKKRLMKIIYGIEITEV